MKLIVEEVSPEEVEVISESVNGKKYMYITGPFMRSEIVNGNGRKYPLRVMENAVNKYNETYIKENRAFGEISHPSSHTINLDRVSHLIVSLVREGNDFIGKAKILETPMGLIAQKIMEGGGKLGVSSRGLGTLVEQNGIKIVQDDFRLATAADIVSDPSAPNAFVTGLMENAEWVFENGLWSQETLEQAKKRINEAKRHELEHVKLQSFNKLMLKLAKS